MNASAWSIKNPVAAIVFFMMLCFFGINSFRTLGVQEYPDIQLPQVIVTANYDGATSSQLETEVVKKIENAVASLQGLKHIYSTVREGTATVTVEFQLEKNGSDATNEVRDAVNQIRADLPVAMRDPIITKVVDVGWPVLTYAVSSEQMDEKDLSWFVDDILTKRMLSLEGVGKIVRVGGVTREISVELDPNKMIQLDITATDVSRLLDQVQRDAPSGRGNVGGGEQSVRTLASAKTLDELKALDLPLPEGKSVRLDRIANIEDSVEERRSLALFNGKPVIGFEVSRTEGENAVAVAKTVRQEVERLARQYPNLTIHQVLDNTLVAQETFTGIMRLLYEGAILAILVVGLFLRDWRATLIVAFALPLSIIPSYWGMQFFGFTFNMLTQLALALVVGVLVDDAIVEIENISRHLRLGKTPLQAANDAVDEIGLAVTATTFALIAVFLPTAFMTGVLGKYFKQFGWTAVLAIFASLLVARLLTPMMAAYWLKPGLEQREKRDSGLMLVYLSAAAWCLRHRSLTILAALAFFIGSLALIPLLPKGFMPPTDYGQTQVNIELPPGSTLDDTLAAAERARQALITEKDVKGVFSLAGSSELPNGVVVPGQSGEVRKAKLTVLLTHREQRDRTQQAVEADLREKLGRQIGVRITVGLQDVGNKLQLVLKSEDPTALRTAAAKLERELRGLKNVGNVLSSASLVQPEVSVAVDSAKAADLGVTASTIGETVRIATAGDFTQSLAKFNLTERQLPIRVKLPQSFRSDLQALARLPVPGKNGPVMLAQVADISMSSEPAVIKRFDRAQQVTLDVELGRRELGDVYAEAMRLPALTTLPASVGLSEFGDAQLMTDMFDSFSSAMVIGVLCIFAVLALLFKDFMQPLTILVAVPLALGGAFVLLLLTGKSFSMPALIGLLMLIGIVTKNSILLVEYAIVAREDRHLPRFDALLDACHKRARPIVMTSLAMGFGMLPVALGWGADPAFSEPLAIAVIGGVITSTLLSLLVVPAMFTCVDDAKLWIRQVFAWTGNQSKAG
ncbi:MAG: efflux RND transporter permease subunit [Methylobacter sp.]